MSFSKELVAALEADGEKLLAETGEDHGPHFEPTFDFNSPEDVLIEVCQNDEGNQGRSHWSGWNIESCTIISGAEGVIGAASYEAEFGGFLNYTIMDLIDPPQAPGFYVVVGVTGVYHKGDGWTTDDDMDFYYKEVRPATADEIKLQ